MRRPILTKALHRRISSNAFGEDDRDILDALRRLSESSPPLEEIIRFTRAIASSSVIMEGRRRTRAMQVVDLARNDTDVPSTGGPTSLSTLVAPILLALCGANILKVSEAGVPAGAIDVLETLDGFQSKLSRDEVLRLAQSPYIHTRQGDVFAPADRTLIKMRRKYGLMACPDLAIASLLAKKVCVGVRAFVVDVRVGPSGNVGGLATAREMSERFVTAASALDMRARCVLTDLHDEPQSPYLGRGESLRGLFDCLTASTDVSHLEALLVLATEALHLCGLARPTQILVARLGRCFQGDPVARVAHLLSGQGVSEETLRGRIEEIRGFGELPIRSEVSGVLKRVDLEGLKNVVKYLYSRTRPNQKRVWEVGLYWQKKLGWLDRGEQVCLVRFRADLRRTVASIIRELTRAVNGCLDVRTDPKGFEGSRRHCVIGVVDERGNERAPVIAYPILQEAIASARGRTHEDR